MKNWFKKLLIPSGEKQTVVAYNSWIVRWESVRFDTSDLVYTKKQSEIFPSEIDANKFAQALTDAHELLKNTNFKIKIEANQSKLATLIEQ